MNICQKHWDDLRHGITSRGLGDFVPKDGKDALKQMQAQMHSGVLTLETFDPLMAANNMIFGVAMERAGLDLLTPNAHTGKPPCPLCHCAGPYAQNWIDGACDEVKKMCERLKQGPVDLNEKPPKN